MQGFYILASMIAAVTSQTVSIDDFDVRTRASEKVDGTRTAEDTRSSRIYSREP